LCLCELVNQNGEISSTQSIDWRNVPYRENLSRIGPVLLDADVRAAALGEARVGAGRNYAVFIYVTIGTGISACLMIEGKPYMGAKGIAGTIASSPLPGQFPNYNRPIPPSLEQIASGPAMAAQYQNQTGRKLSGKQVADAVQHGDRVAMEVMTTAGGAMGAIIGWLINSLDPEAVILGGGVGAGVGMGNDVYRASLVESARRYTWSELHREIPIIPAALGQDAGIIGAASQALNPNAFQKKATK
jgi:glucokinase